MTTFPEPLAGDVIAEALTPHDLFTSEHFYIIIITEMVITWWIILLDTDIYQDKIPTITLCQLLAYA